MGCRTEESSGKGSGRTFPSNWLSLDQKMLSGIWERKVFNDLTQWYTMYYDNADRQTRCAHRHNSGTTIFWLDLRREVMTGTVKLIKRPQLWRSQALVGNSLLLFYKMHKCSLNICAYTHRQMLLSVLSEKVLSATNSSGWRNSGSWKDWRTDNWGEGFEMLYSKHDMAIAFMNSGHLAHGLSLLGVH